MSAGNRCDCCYPPCACGAFCSNSPYCGYNMHFVFTMSGASGACSCAGSMNIASSFTGYPTPYTAAVWNAGWGATSGLFGLTDAKADSAVCAWEGTSPLAAVSCGASNWTFLSPRFFVVLGTDDKWRAAFLLYYGESVNTPYFGFSFGDGYLAGEILLDKDVGSNVGAAVNCGTVGESSPTFHVNIPVSLTNVTGTISLCSLPTNVLIEGDPQ